MDKHAIGVFDSGLGGLTAVRELNKILPNENIIYFGDTARIPYGTRSRNTVLRYAKEDIEFLRKHDIKMIIAACGTVSSVIGDITDIDGIPFTGVLIPASKSACNATKNGKIGIIGTPATIRSGSFKKTIEAMRPDAQVFANPCPLFVHLVENGYIDRQNKVTKIVAEEYLEPIRKAGVDTLILGCTHYPIIKDIIADYMGDDVTLIDTGAEAAKYAKKCLSEKNLLSGRSEKGKNTFYVSDSIELFGDTAGIFLGHDVSGDVFSSIINQTAVEK